MGTNDFRGSFNFRQLMRSAALDAENADLADSKRRFAVCVFSVNQPPSQGTEQVLHIRLSLYNYAAFSETV
jgi:hypothetical protein